jgi:hypothetical protein
MTTVANNNENRVTRTHKGFAYRTIANHIKSTVFGIDEYDVVVDCSEFGGHIFVSRKDADEPFQIADDLCFIVRAYKASSYIAYDKASQKIVFTIF